MAGNVIKMIIHQVIVVWTTTWKMHLLFVPLHLLVIKEDVVQLLPCIQNRAITFFDVHVCTSIDVSDTNGEGESKP
jgi:hypothetical protein